MIPLPLIRSGAAEFGLTLSTAQLEAFELYGNFLIEYNQTVNLTAITEPTEVAIKHFVDSIAVAGLFDFPKDASLVDVGTGAGFPGVPLKIMRPDLRLTLLDSLAKRLSFLSKLSLMLGQHNILLHARAEQAGADSALRERFDLATARAVSRLPALCEYCLPLVKVGGSMLALKGPDCEAEVDAARAAIRLLGGGEPDLIPYTLPDGSGRTLVVIPKRSQTPTKYPRQRINLTEKPL